MPAFTMQDLERLAAIEQGTGSSTSQHQIDSNTLQHVPAPKSDVRRDIYAVVMMDGGLVSRAGIAKLLNLKKSPWLVSAIEELVKAGYLLKYVEERPNQIPKFYYAVPV